MDWLKNNFERAILIAAAAALLACCALVINSALSFPNHFANRNSPKPPDNAVRPLPTESLVSALRNIKSPQNWTVHEGSLLVSRPYVLLNGSLIDPLEGNKKLHEPIKNSWLIRYDLPYWESNIKEQDPDGDHFSNLEEYLASSDPRDANSMPPFFTKLRLLRFISRPFRLIFTGSPDDGQTFMINTRERAGRTRFVQVGQMVEGTPYKVISYEQKTERKNEIDVDASILTIENTQTSQQIALIANRETNDPTSFGEFVYLYDNSKFIVKKDDEFTLAPEHDKKYKLIDISEEGALIQDQQTREQHKVPSA